MPQSRQNVSAKANLMMRDAKTWDFKREFAKCISFSSCELSSLKKFITIEQKANLLLIFLVFGSTY